MKYQELFEMKIQYNEGNDSEYIFAYNAFIWVTSDDTDEEIIHDICEKINMDELYFCDDSGDLYNYIYDNRPDVLAVYYDPSTNTIDDRNGTNISPDVVSSPLYKKVIDALNIKYINFQSIKKTIISDIATGTIPNQMFHGTSSKNIFNILSKGLMPNPSLESGNFEFKLPYVFLTSKYEKALYHATQSSNNEYNKNYKPIIIKLNIPDASKLVMDFDVGDAIYKNHHKAMKQLGYDKYANDEENLEVQAGDKHNNVGMYMGIYGYKGRIPASYFDLIYISNGNDNTNNMIEMSVEEFIKKYKK